MALDCTAVEQATGRLHRGKARAVPPAASEDRQIFVETET
jgi:hypothetical protein